MIINGCLDEDDFVSFKKLALLGPPLRKAGLHGDNLSNYCFISNFLSKLTE